MLCLLSLSLAISAATAELPANVRWLHRGTDPASLPDRFKAELSAAKAKREAVIVVFTADWCTPCKAMKELLAGNQTVRAASRGSQILFIDVDEWRGPAQALIPGVDAAQLPTVVRVDDQGRSLVRCFGTDLGLLSASATAKNLVRLVKGLAPERPDYDADSKATTALAVEDNARQQALAKSHPLTAAKVVARNPGVGGRPETRFRLSLTLQSHDAMRRWVVVPRALGAQVPEAPVVVAWRERRFAEHVRATLIEVDIAAGSPGAPGFWMIPVSGFGQATLGGLEVAGPKAGGTLEVWHAALAQIDGKPVDFQKKLPYQLKVANAANSVVIWSAASPKALQLRVGTRTPMAIK